MKLLDVVKLSLRTATATYDKGEILPLLAACKQDLNLAGVRLVDEDDPLTRQAFIFYCKAYFGFNEDGEKWAAAYEKLKSAMALAGEYREEGTDAAE